jgi:phosphopantetheine adenylyltransferase
MYDFRGSYHNKCTVKLPVRFLGMTDEEILKENREAAIKALEEQRKELEDRIDEVKKPINDKIAKIDAQIEALKKDPANENV